MQLFLFVNKLSGFFSGFFGGFMSLNFPLLIGFKVVFLMAFFVVFFNKKYWVCFITKICIFWACFGIKFHVSPSYIREPPQRQTTKDKQNTIKTITTKKTNKPIQTNIIKIKPLIQP